MRSASIRRPRGSGSNSETHYEFRRNSGTQYQFRQHSAGAGLHILDEALIPTDQPWGRPIAGHRAHRGRGLPMAKVEMRCRIALR